MQRAKRVEAGGREVTKRRTGGEEGCGVCVRQCGGRG